MLDITPKKGWTAESVVEALNNGDAYWDHSLDDPAGPIRLVADEQAIASVDHAELTEEIGEWKVNE